MIRQKVFYPLIFVVISLLFSDCGSGPLPSPAFTPLPTDTPSAIPGTPTPTFTPVLPTSSPTIIPQNDDSTSVCSFPIVETRIGDRVPPNCDLSTQFSCWATAPEGYKILFVVFKRPDGGDAMGLDEAEGVYVIASDGSKSNVEMAGNFLGPTFVFTVLNSSHEFKLVCPSGSPVELGN